MVGVAVPHRSPSVTGPSFRIELLGPPRITRGDDPLVLPRRQLRALLYRLAAAPTPVPRDQLCFLFWPDVPEAVARRYLVVLLTHLRRALACADALVASADAVGLDQRLVVSDVALATTALAVAPALSTPPNHLAAAVDLYRGPFLDGFVLPGRDEFETWLGREREAWERRYLDALGALIEARVADGEYPAAIAAARRYLATDELAEAVHRRLIALYAVTGDRAAALRQFDRCAAVLNDALGVQPQPETRAVYEAVRDGRGLIPARPAASRPGRPPPDRGAGDLVPALSLPAPPNPLIGRVTEVAEACAALTGDDVRLLTLCGAGGSGKTRLALDVAWRLRDRFADDVVFVPLAPVRDPAQVVGAVARACGLQELGSATPGELLGAALRERNVLLVLDNCEHLLGALPMLADLLAAAPRLRMLATSRVRLDLSGEHLLYVPPLPLPDPAHLPPLPELADQPAVALLMARARAADPAFRLTAQNAADLAAICVRLDGLPLAIELAAARLKLLSPRALLARLDHRLAALPDGPRDLPERQRTLRATIAWSDGLLDADGQGLFARLAVFAGGFTPAAAEALCGANGDAFRPVLDGLAGLLDAHLLTRDAGVDGEVRLGMLETIREYAAERLHERGEGPALRRAHAVYFCTFAEQRGPPPEASALPAALAELDRDYHNVRAALDWALGAGEAEVAMRIAGSLLVYWDTRGLFEEGRAWHARVLRLAASAPQPFRSRVRVQAGHLAYRQGRLEEAADFAAVVLADAQTAAPEIVAAANLAGQAATEVGDIAGARAHFEHAIAVATHHGSLSDGARAQFNLGYLNLAQGDLAGAEGHFRASRANGERLQHARNAGFALVGLGAIALLRGEPQPAAELLEEALRRLIAVRDTTPLLYALLACGGLATLHQQPLRAAMLFGAATRHAERAGARLPRGVLALVRPWVDRARGQTAGDTFEHAWEAGGSLSLDDAVALARRGDRPAA